MKKNLIIRTLACLIGFLILLPGCDQTATKPATPKIIRKKIQAKTVQKTRTPDANAVASAKPAPAPAPEPAAKQTDTGEQAPQQTLIAQKSEPASAKTSKAKPPIEPKSDISIIQPSGTPAADAQTGSDQETATPTSPNVAAKSPSKVPPVYDPRGKIDPFEPLFKETPEVAQVTKVHKKRAPQTPLERIDISQLKLVGIILAKSGNKALVEESSGKGYIIKPGTYLGTNSGKVVKIEKDRVIVAEEYEDVLGKVTLRNTEIKLPKPPGEL
jgi:type IV pilus assembly protein PilP